MQQKHISEKFITIHAYLKKQDISNKQPNFTPQRTRKRRMKPKVSRRKEVSKIRVEINETKTVKTIERSMKLKRFFEKTNKVDKPLAKLTKKKGERAQINKVENEKGDITTDTTEIQKIIRDYHEQLYISKLDNLEDMDKCLETYYLPRLNHEKLENLKTDY